MENTLGTNSSEYFRDPKTGTVFSDLDLKYGLKELDPEAVKRAKKYKTSTNKSVHCSMFWTTHAATLKIQSMLTADELGLLFAKLEESYLSVKREIEITAPTVNKPWKLYLCGNDDSSWTRAYHSKEEVHNALDAIRKRGFGYVSDHMMFTN